MLDQITPLILTYNEAANIGRTLQQLTWAKRIVVIDSFSDDETLEILSKCDRVQVFQRRFDTHTEQWNYGLDQVSSNWALSLDSDYFVTDQLISEIASLQVDSGVDGYFAKFKYCVFGKPLRGTILPPRQVLFRKSKSIYIDDGHTQLLRVNGKSTQLSAYIYHDDRKTLSRWLKSQDRYMQIESKKILFTPYHELGLGDRIRKAKYIAPFIILIYCLILKGSKLS